MLTRSQLLILTLIATLGGSFAALLVIGIFSGDFTFAAVNLVIIVAIFLSVFFFKDDRPKNKNIANRSISRELYLQAAEQRKEYASIAMIENKQANDSINRMRRAGDVHVGGEPNPEFR